ncbi:Uncharacterized conserved protein YjiS, DUF1127 family [Pseudomonas mucidolens]|uniref:Uncharacterized conserved protein YjiS, DUF1127 family n=2 Tax=Pseudomonas mucidolens TaxID=46679 RepID=A0A1H2N0X4_9PSED|nr:DUF1127 domain-containing protein [Pseudomonas mucidolens]SDU98974.1 Uncharacterized conserved protein YjiS, DUF1127 family [Pseudomonas mucidolens]SQH32863.1 Uncharacterized conserved small protein [Pseudomonas mucidolens]
MMKGQRGYVLMVKRPFSGLFQRISRWSALHRERQLLAGLTDESLKDIGLTRADVEPGRHRHFWNDPLGK